MPRSKPQQIALRDALNVWTWQHLTRHPRTWFSEHELARVIREQYACEPPLVGRHQGRTSVIHEVLCYLENRGEAVMRTSHAGESGSGRPRREWRVAAMTAPAPAEETTATPPAEVAALADAVTELGGLALAFAAINRTCVRWPDQVTPESDTDH